MGVWGRTGKVPVVYLGNRQPRFMLSDLDATLLQKRYNRRVWDQNDKELPVPVVCRLLGLAEASVWAASHRGQLPDFTEKSVRKYIERQLMTGAKKKIHAKYRQIMQNQHQVMKRLRVQLKATKCLDCSKSIYRKPARIGKWMGVDAQR